LSFEFSFEDKNLRKNCENVKVFCQKTDKKFRTKIKKDEDGFL